RLDDRDPVGHFRESVRRETPRLPRVGSFYSAGSGVSPRRITGNNRATKTSVPAAAAYGSTRLGETWNNTLPRNGPRIRPRDANDWLTPCTSPCRAGSARQGEVQGVS